MPAAVRGAALLVLACVCIGALAALTKSEGGPTAEGERSFSAAERAAFAQLQHLEASFAYEPGRLAAGSETMRTGWHRAKPSRSKRDARHSRHHHNTPQQRLGMTSLQAVQAGDTSERETGWEERGNGATHFLDRQDVDCDGAPLTGFVLKTEGEGDDRRLAYAFTCMEGAGLDAAADERTAVQDDGGGTLIFLDRLNVDCGNEAALSQFRLVRDGDTQNHYQYTCLTSHADNTDIFGECSVHQTAPNEGGDGAAKVEFLDRHNVKCHRQQVLTRFQLHTSDGGLPNGKIFYEYTCCDIAALEEAATEADTNSTSLNNATDVAGDTLNSTANNSNSNNTNLTEPDAVPSTSAYISPASLGAAGAEAFHAFIMSHENFTVAVDHATKVGVVHARSLARARALSLSLARSLARAVCLSLYVCMCV